MILPVGQILIDPLPLRLFVEVWIAMILLNIWFYIGYKIAQRRKKR
jgi:hypothetical protein